MKALHPPITHSTLTSMSSLKTLLSLSLVSMALAASGYATETAGAAAPSGQHGKSYFIDVHELGAGKVTAAGVADAHRADLAVQAKHGVRFIDYWVDEAQGRVFCLSEAKSAPAIVAAHREAHGLLPAKILPVTDGAPAAPGKGGQLFLDVHDFGAGNVTAKAVAEAHKQDLAVQADFGVRFLNYWVDEVNGKVLCLSEAPNADAIREAHRRAHGLLPESIEAVTAGK